MTVKPQCLEFLCQLELGEGLQCQLFDTNTAGTHQFKRIDGHGLKLAGGCGGLALGGQDLGSIPLCSGFQRLIQFNRRQQGTLLTIERFGNAL